MNNRAVEDAAIAFVPDWEAKHGRLSHDARGAGAVANTERTIGVEAYGRSARGHDLWLEVRQVEEAGASELLALRRGKRPPELDLELIN